MRGGIGTSFPIWARFVFVCGGGFVVIYACAAIGGKYLLDDPAFVLVSLLAFWVAGSAWVLAGRANDANGWGQLEVSEIILIPLVTLAAMFGSIFLLGVIGLGHMR